MKWAQRLGFAVLILLFVSGFSQVVSAQDLYYSDTVNRDDDYNRRYFVDYADDRYDDRYADRKYGNRYYDDYYDGYSGRTYRDPRYDSGYYRYDVFGNRFDPHVDLRDINWFDRELYFRFVNDARCIDLDEFYAYADSDPFDRWTRDDIRRYKNRLSYDDYQRYKLIYPSENTRSFNKLSDFRCSDRREYNTFADRDRFDRFDRDDYYRLYGFDDRNDYLNRIRHSPFEQVGPTLDRYTRSDGNGGIASSIRPVNLGTSFSPDPRYLTGTRTTVGNGAFTPVPLDQRHPMVNYYSGAIDFLSL